MKQALQKTILSLFSSGQFNVDSIQFDNSVNVSPYPAQFSLLAVQLKVG